MKNENKIRKMIAMMVVGTILTSQIGCANRVTHASLSNAAFDPKYSYTIKTNQNINFSNVPGSEIQNLSDRIYIKQNSETKYLLHNQITEIDGRTYDRIGSHALEGLGIGAGAGALTGIAFANLLIWIYSGWGDEFCTGDECGTSTSERVNGSLIGAGMGVGIGKFFRPRYIYC